ncbi:T9SS ring complex lipoprotein PorK/GldK [Maribellus maritimus]|uniref:type IX secretion system lipoprotein PorK/GldK n=1 Tax=Maribellus maritimus TaxID=2870838 RepID=UPI001EEB85B6|nr:SUMF1/EgtB/PvdO family nonheme iron enzyme [Maribellus maritimus]MCG6189612.1 SUMF1/EgtB/PvdO family nonheme iron enzyme [Maribellus maritimus]
MKKLLYFGIVLLSILTFTSCNQSGGNGELVGVQDRGKWSESQPYGMVYVRRGSFNIGPSDQDPSKSMLPTKTVSQEAFWMDDTEITNSEYRQFTNWVKDSIARRMLGDQYPEFLITEDREGNPIDPPRINWRERIDWEDPDMQMAMQDLYIPENERFFGKKEIDTRKLLYEYWWIDIQQAAKRSNSYNFENQRYEGNVYNAEGELIPIENRSSFIMQDEAYIYPDTLCWIRDFTYSFNEPWATRYFWHPGFAEYPVVGVTWEQARAFCSWRTKIQTTYLNSRGEPELQAYRLPSEVEWEYAARGGKTYSMYPWGGYYARDEEGVFLANFKPLRGNYVEDGGIGAMKVGSYEPNEYGLYDMSGNVAEWTETAYDEAGYQYFSDINPSFTYNARPDDPPVMKRKVIRGGSWKDIAHYIQVSTRSYEYQDTTKSFIGFRCVRSTFGDEFN